MPILRRKKTSKSPFFLLGDDSFDVKKVLGEGAYAKVFKVQSVGTGAVKVLKYQKPAFPWELYIAREIQARSSGKQAVSI